MRVLRQGSSTRLWHPLRKERRFDSLVLLFEVQGQRLEVRERPKEVQVGEEAEVEMSSPGEETLIVVKPDGVKRGLVGEILGRFEAKGFTIKRLEMTTFSRAQAEDFYGVHRDKPFFSELVAFISSGPVVGAILSGRDAVATVRRMVGATKSWEAAAGTIRGDLGLGLTDNAVHASDSAESFTKERAVFFGPTSG
jgi:nucleoside-diphosphate kinase